MEILINGGRNPHLTDSLYPGVITISYKKAILHKQPLLLLQKNKTNNSNYFTDKDKDTSYDESKASTVKLSGSSASVSGDGIAVSGSTVTISKAGTYVISGESDGVQIKVEAGDSDDVHIVLKGVTMTNTNAPISATKAGHVYLTLADGTTNTLV